MKGFFFFKSVPAWAFLRTGFSPGINLIKKPREKRGFNRGPTWARTKDHLIMSQVL